MRSLALRSSPCRWVCLRMERAESQAGFMPPSSSRASQYCSSLCVGACKQCGKDRGETGEAGASLDCGRKGNVTNVTVIQDEKQVNCDIKTKIHTLISLRKFKMEIKNTGV